jgi:hypothetical protein
MEKHYTTFDDCDLPTLIKHCLTSLKETSQNGDINAKNTSVSIFFSHFLPFSSSFLIFLAFSFS